MYRHRNALRGNAEIYIIYSNKKNRNLNNTKTSHILIIAEVSILLYIHIFFVNNFDEF